MSSFLNTDSTVEVRPRLQGASEKAPHKPQRPNSHGLLLALFKEIFPVGCTRHPDIESFTGEGHETLKILIE